MPQNLALTIEINELLVTLKMTTGETFAAMLAKNDV